MSKEQNILLVGSPSENVEVLVTLLSDVDCHLLRAESSHEVASCLSNYDIALAILDLHSPDINRFDVADQIRTSSKTKKTPIVFIAASNKEEKYVDKSQGLGAVDYIFKPINPDVLCDKVRFFLNLDMQKRRLEEKLRKSQESKEAFMRAMGVAASPNDKDM